MKQSHSMKGERQMEAVRSSQNRKQAEDDPG